MSEGQAAEVQEPRGAEKRKHIRLSLMGLARISVRGGETQAVYMGCIGRGGAGLYMHQELKSGQLVVLHLDLMKGWKGGEMKLAARARYCMKTGELYMVGLQFEKIGEDRYAFLLRQLKEMKDQQL